MCMNRIAAISATSPERPWPEKNQRRLSSRNASTEALEPASVHALQRFRYLASDGQPRPGLRNRSLIHVATLLGSSAPVIALPTITISGSTCEHGVKGLRPQSASKRNAKASTSYLRNSVDMRR